MIEFKLNEVETKVANDFLKEHMHSEVNKGAIGGHIKYIFVPTSIGDACTIHCSICDKELNITDYTSW